jgi:steroid 5-alpha reductase family enzyme
MFEFSSLLLSSLILVFFFHLMFVIALWRQDNSIADVVWGLGFIVVSLTSFLLASTFLPRQVLVLLLTLLWGVRLSLHIWWRNRGRGEDARYAAWRKNWGKRQALYSYLQVFLLQSLLLLIVAAPLHVIHLSVMQSDLTLLDWLGGLIFLFGLTIETIADAQLLAFRRVKKPGEILQTGLWRYSRHPNYFGEITLWWGMGILALSLPGGWIGLLGPLTITFLITRVSGIPLLEKRYEHDREYQAYAKRTSVLIPWLPRSSQ